MRGMALFASVLVILAVNLPLCHGHASPLSPQGASGDACACAVPSVDALTAFPIPALNGRPPIIALSLHDTASPNLLDPPPKSGFIS